MRIPDSHLPVVVLILSAAACAHGGTLGEAEPVPGITTRLADPTGEEIGAATLERMVGAWRLEIEVSPPEGTSAGEAFVVRGDCARASGRIVQLAAFVADGVSAFESATEFPSAWLKAGTRYAITVDGSDGARIACGDLGAF